MTAVRPATPRLAVFDCDGTLVDGQGAVVAAMIEAFAGVALPQPDPNAIRRIVGLSLGQAVQQLVPSADADTVRTVVAGYKSAFRAARAAGELSEPLYPGIPELLAALTGAGWTLGVATHRIAQHFATLQTADRHPSKPHPAMLQAALDEAGIPAAAAVMIGDTAYDMLMAREAGVPAVGVAWGYHEAAELVAAGAEFVADTAEQLKAYLLR